MIQQAVMMDSLWIDVGDYIDIDIDFDIDIEI